MKSTPIIALQNECGEAPIPLRKTEILMQHAARITSNPTNPSKESLADTWHSYIPRFTGKSIYEQITPIQTSFDNIVKRTPSPNPPWAHNVPTIDTQLSNLVDKEKQNNLVLKQSTLAYMAKYNEYTPIYTDGSKEEEKTACAFITTGHISQHRLPDDSDILEAELQAISMAGQHLVDHPEIQKAVMY